MGEHVMKDAPTGWSEPTPQRLAGAMDSYDHVAGGGKPRNPIENGIRIMRKLMAEYGIVEDEDARGRTVAAVARVMDLDDEMPKARIPSLMAARMMIVDVSLQRDAAIARDMDVIDRREWFSATEAGGRGAAWMMANGMSDAVRRMDESSVDALASGEFHFAGGAAGAALKTSMESLRMKGGLHGRGMDVDLLRVSGLLPESEARDMKSRIGSRVGRLELGDEIHRISRKASLMDERKWPDPVRRDREFPSDTGIINLRMGRNERERNAGFDDVVVSDGHRLAARAAIADARLSNPDTESGRAVKAALTVLSDLGVEPRFMEGPAFDRTVASAIANTSTHDREGVMPDTMGARIVGSTLIRREADAHIAHQDLRFPSGTEREAAWNRKAGTGIDPFITSSKRDRADLDLIVQGRFEETSDRFGMRSSLKGSLSSLRDDYRPLALVRLELEAMSSSPQKEVERIERFEGRRPEPMSKGPETVRSGSEWIASMASLAKGGASR
jgi:hypothetical protein